MAILAHTEVPNCEPGTIFTRRDKFNIGPGNIAILLTRPEPRSDAQLLLLNEQGRPLIVIPATGKDAHNRYDRLAPDPHLDDRMVEYGFIRTGEGDYVPASPEDTRIKGYYEGYRPGKVISALTSAL